MRAPPAAVLEPTYVVVVVFEVSLAVYEMTTGIAVDINETVPLIG